MGKCPMKASDKPEISKRFLEQLPKDFKCSELQKAITNCEKALKESNAKNTMAALKRVTRMMDCQ